MSTLGRTPLARSAAVCGTALLVRSLIPFPSFLSPSLWVQVEWCILDAEEGWREFREGPMLCWGAVCGSSAAVGASRSLFTLLSRDQDQGQDGEEGKWKVK